MASHGTRRRVCDQVAGEARRLAEGDTAGLRELLPAERVERAVVAEGVKFRRPPAGRCAAVTAKRKSRGPFAHDSMAEKSGAAAAR